MERPDRHVPRIDAEVIALTAVDEIVSGIGDNLHIKRYEALRETNPELARELLKRAYLLTEKTPELQNTVLDFGTYVVELFKNAEEIAKRTSADGDVAVDQQPSSELHDDQLIDAPDLIQPDPLR